MIGGEALRNKGISSVTIKSIDLIDPEGLLLEEAFLIPIDEASIGAMAGSSPDPTSSAYASWLNRKDAEGASISPGDDQDLLLVLRASGESEEHFARDLEVIYSDESGEDHRLTTAGALRLETTGPCVA